MNSSSTHNTPELSIIIVNWNGGNYIRLCLQSILAYPPQLDFDIVVVDNVSTDDSLQYLESMQRELPPGKLKLFKNTINVGFSKANNQAFRYSRAPLLFLMNPDAELRPGSINCLVELMRSDDRIALCGPRIINSDGSLQPSVWPNPSTPIEILVADLHLYRILPATFCSKLLIGPFWQHSERRLVSRLSGAALLARRSAIEQAGGLDESFHMYGEDVEWCYRMSRSGFRVVFEPSSTVLHYGGQSSMLRWGSEEETILTAIKAYLEYERACLPVGHALANSLARVAAVWAHLFWRKIRFVRADGMTRFLSRKNGIFVRQLRRLTSQQAS